MSSNIIYRVEVARCSHGVLRKLPKCGVSLDFRVTAPPTFVDIPEIPVTPVLSLLAATVVL